jgi:hypothetical protein
MSLLMAPSAALSADYVFVPDTSRWVEVLRREGDVIYWSIGKLDMAGTFVPHRDFCNMRGERSNAPPDTTLLYHDQTGPVYEYRSGRLIKGAIDSKTLSFVPEVGSKVIDFKEYRYGKDVAIWNLPGTFKKAPGDRPE